MLLLALLLPTLAFGAVEAEAAPGAVGSSAVASPSANGPQSAQSPGDVPRFSGLALPPVPAEYSTYEAGWISIAYHPSLSARVGQLKLTADDVKAQLAASLGRPVLGRVHVRVGRTVGEMATLTPRGSNFPKYASGLAYPDLDLVLLTSEPRYAGEKLDLLEVFRHELAHVALHHALGNHDVPRWFNEGFAVHASGEARAARLQTLWTATLAKTLLPLRDLTARFPTDATEASVAYAQASDIVRFLLKGDEGPRFRALIERVADGQAFDAALADSYATDVASLESEWRADVARRYSFWPIVFGGSTLWAGALVLFFWGYAKRRRRAAAKLAVWARDEAVEDARRLLLQTTLGQAGAVHIVFSRSGSDPELVAAPRREDERGETSDSYPGSAHPGSTRPSSVPQIEHDGGWHTLH